MRNMSAIVYTCTVPWRNRHTGTLVLYCSDDRFARAMHEFLWEGLGLEGADQYVVPGGPACLVMSTFTFHDYDVARRRLSLLGELHGLTRAILIAHQDCGFYRAMLPEADAAQRRRAQEEHLREAARVLRAWFPTLKASLYYAFVARGHVVLEAVEGGRDRGAAEVTP
jgi:hypothetical protein